MLIPNIWWRSFKTGGRNNDIDTEFFKANISQ